METRTSRMRLTCNSYAIRYSKRKKRRIRKKKKKEVKDVSFKEVKDRLLAPRELANMYNNQETIDQSYTTLFNKVMERMVVIPE